MILRDYLKGKFNMKKLIVLLSALCLMPSFAGCESKESVSDTVSKTVSESTETKTSEETLPTEEISSSEEESSESEDESAVGDITDVIKNEGGLNYYMSKCGRFTLGISEEL